MSIDIRELERLHEAAVRQKSCPAAYLEEANYLCRNVPEILAALRDRERLDKLERNGANFRIPDEASGSLRAAIDAMEDEG